MKKIIITCMLALLVINAVAITNQPNIKTTQNIINFDDHFDIDTIPPTVPTNTEFILSYKIEMDTIPEKNSIVDCEISFPKDVNINLISCWPIQMLNYKKNEIPAFATYESSDSKKYEFLIANNSKECIIQFSVTIPNNYSKTVPIDLDYIFLEETLMTKIKINKYNIAKSVIAKNIATSTLLLGPVAGPAVGTAVLLNSYESTPITDYTTRITTEEAISKKDNQDLLKEMKEIFRTKRMDNSSAQFSLQIK